MARMDLGFGVRNMGVFKTAGFSLVYRFTQITNRAWNPHLEVEKPGKLATRHRIRTLCFLILAGNTPPLKTPNFFVVEAKRRIFCFLSFTVVFFFSKKERKKSSRTPLGQSSRTPLSLPASKPMMLEAPGPPFIQIRFGVTSARSARSAGSANRENSLPTRWGGATETKHGGPQKDKQFW